MASSQIKGIYKVLLQHLLTHPFSKLNVPVPNDALSLASSKFAMNNRNDGTKDWLELALPNYFRVLKATSHINLYNFLLDAYIAAAMIEDTVWQGKKLIAANKHNMLRKIGADIVRLTLFLVNKDALLLVISVNDGMDIDMAYRAEGRGEYKNMDPYEVLGIKPLDKEVVFLSEWRDRFWGKAERIFMQAGMDVRSWKV